MKIKVSEATEIQLDWMVCKAAGMFEAYPKYGAGKKFRALHTGNSAKYIHPSTDWAQGGPIIERERINLNQCGSSRPGGKMHWFWEASWGYENEPGHTMVPGPTPLIAAMRCYVASKLGDEVEVPEELK